MRPDRAVAILFLLVALVVLGAAGVWTFVAQQFMTTAIVADNQSSLDRGRAGFELVRGQTREALRSQCRVLVEDPRLKSTLATEGIDEATVADILGDLAKLRRTGLLVVLTPDGHVFAEANADELRGLDLSASSVFKKLQGSADAVIGSWVIGGKLIDLGATAIRFNSNVIAYLVVGQTVDRDLITAVAEATNVELAVMLGNDVILAFPDPANARRSGGERYVTATYDLEDSPQAHSRLVVSRALAPSLERFESMRWLLWLVPPLVLVALLLSALRSRAGGSV